MMNKRGEVVLRDIIMLIIVFTGIIALASIFVNDVGDTYSNTNMTSSYNQDSIGETQLSDTAQKWEEIGNNLDGNLFDMLTGTFQAASAATDLPIGPDLTRSLDRAADGLDKQLLKARLFAVRPRSTACKTPIHHRSSCPGPVRFVQSPRPKCRVVAACEGP